MFFYPWWPRSHPESWSQIPPIRLPLLLTRTTNVRRASIFTIIRPMASAMVRTGSAVAGPVSSMISFEYRSAEIFAIISSSRFSSFKITLPGFRFRISNWLGRSGAQNHRSTFITTRVISSSGALSPRNCSSASVTLSTICRADPVWLSRIISINAFFPNLSPA